MDRAEKLEYEQGIEQYFDENKVYDLFEKLFKELVINKPEDPIDYLIERLGREETKRIFITGYPGTEHYNVSQSIAESLGYKCFDVNHLLEKASWIFLKESQKIPAAPWGSTATKPSAISCSPSWKGSSVRTCASRVRKSSAGA